MNSEFSVLMSIYIKETEKNTRACFESLERQTVKATEWVIVEDGKLTKELYNLLDEYELKYPNIIKRIPIEKNVGLGLALQRGILACNYNLIARMDTDDICKENRFEKQLSEFEKDPNLDICSSHILEFEGKKDNIVARRKVPLSHNEIKKYQKRRDGFNHVAVMFKKSSVLAAGNYQSCLLMEDTLLWANMFLSGAKAKNIDDYLVYVRIGKDMFERRGGYDYFKKYKEGRKKVYETGFISKWDYAYTLIIQFIVAMVPNNVRGWIFTKFLHG